MKMNSARQLKKLVNELHEWCADPTTDRREEIYKSLRKELASNRPRAAAVATGDLRSLANWYGQHGSLAILDGRIEGWADIDRSLHYEWWSIRIDTSMIAVPEAALTLAHALVFEEESMAEWLAERMISSLDDGAFSCWHSATFGVFILKLWAIHRGLSDVNVTRPDVSALGVYQHVLDAWSNPAELRAALIEACDYHLAQSRTAMGYPPFVYSPYQIFPVDMLAIAVVRRGQGLEMPAVEHPLLSTPLATPPPREQRPRMKQPDPLLDQVIAKAKATGFL